MTDDINRFSQGLQDLITIREKLNRELESELDRSNKLAKAVSQLQRLNNAAQDHIEETLYRIGVWKDAPDLPGKPEADDGVKAMAARYAPPLRMESTSGDELGLYDDRNSNSPFGPN